MHNHATKEELTRAGRIARLASLDQIYVKGLDAELLLPRDEVVQVQTIEFLHSEKCTPAYDPDSGEIEIEADLSVTVFDAGKDDEGERISRSLVSVDGRFVLLYSVQRPADVDENEFLEAIQAFARVNGVYNVWPYFRELVQNMTARMGIPPITLPLLTVKVKTEESKAPEPTEHESKP